MKMMTCYREQLNDIDPRLASTHEVRGERSKTRETPAMDALLAWAARCGHFPGPELDNFREFADSIAPLCHQPGCVQDDVKIDEGAFGSIVRATFAPPGRQVRRTRRRVLCALMVGATRHAAWIAAASNACHVRRAASHPLTLLLARRQDTMRVAVKYVKPVQRMSTRSMERKPVHVVFRELQLEVEALKFLPSRHRNVVGLEAVVARFPAETDPNQEVRVGRVHNFQSLRVLRREHASKVLKGSLPKNARARR